MSILGAALLDQIEAVNAFFANVDLAGSRAAAFNSTELARAIGITRIGAATQLDRIGIPNFYAVRPDAKHPCAIVSSGKALTARGAELSAIFESYERWAAEAAAFSLSASLAQLTPALPDTCIVLAPRNLGHDAAYKWCFGLDLLANAIVLAPSDVVEFPPTTKLFPRTTTTGLAAHTDFFAALRNGALESLERHFLADLNFARLQSIEMDQCPDALRPLLAAFSDNDITMNILRATDSAPFAAVYCYSIDERMGLPQLCCSGFAADETLEGAILRAMLEVTQSRSAFFTGLRDDVGQRVAPRSSVLMLNEQLAWRERIRSETQTIRYSDIAADQTPSRDAASFCTKLKALSFVRRLCVFPLRTAASAPALRIFIPGARDFYDA